MSIQFVQQFEDDCCIAAFGAGGVSGQRVVLCQCRGCPFIEQAVHGHVACLRERLEACVFGIGQAVVSVAIAGSSQF